MITAMTGGKKPVEFYVDDDDAWVLGYKWHPQYDNRDGRLSAISATIRENGKQTVASLHRMILKQENRSGTIIDHKDGNPANNCKDNLRLCSALENSRNCKKNKKNTTGYKGVSYRLRDRKYQAYIYVMKRFRSLGYFDTAEETHKAYCIAARELFGEFARVV